MSDNTGFYHDIAPFQDFRDVVNPACFHEVPGDWWVILTDVKGSTKAIEEGRYREVNLVGAACITAIFNALKGIEIPAVFGGDGATLLVPNSKLDTVRRAMTSMQKLALEQFGFELRAGAVPISELQRQGTRVLVGKYELSPGNTLAQLSGGGLSLAEKMLKQGSSSAVSFQPDASSSNPDLTGLSCRWSPFSSRKGAMLSLLVLGRGGHNEVSQLYGHLLSRIEHALGHNLKQANPASTSGLQGKWPSSSILRETKLNVGSGKVMPWHWLKYALIHAFAIGVVSFNLNIKSFSAKKYKEELVLNCDYKKVDDVLRMVFDCSEEQFLMIQKELEQLRQNGKLWYGLHRSPEAVMTCFVTSASENQHLHFIDGSHGGYAMAAKMMKEQISADG